MEERNELILTTELSQQITACTFSKEDLKTLCEILQESAQAAVSEEVNHYMLPDLPHEQIEVYKKLSEKFELKVMVRGADNKEFFGTIPTVFKSPHFPDKLKSLYINSGLDLRDLYNWPPRNRFELLLDFTKPELVMHSPC